MHIADVPVNVPTSTANAVSASRVRTVRKTPWS